MDIDTSQFRYIPGTYLDRYATRWDELDNASDEVAASVERLSELQELLWADDRYAVLLIFQGMDAAGKDGTIKRVTSGVNPAGFQVFSFRQPSPEEIDHNFLWRYWRAMPERGRIGIFNRSYYEEVMVVRVHPEIIEQRPLPHEHVDADFWAHRLEDIAAMERHLWRNGTLIVKFLLHLSRAEQKKRLIARLSNHEKLWKFDPNDLEERSHWDAHQTAFQDAMTHTDHDHAPWFVMPADDKWAMRALVARVLTEQIGKLDLAYPQASQIDDAWVERALNRLHSEPE